MGHVTYIIWFGLRLEYLGPSMTSPASHVIPKNEIFGPKNGVDNSEMADPYPAAPGMLVKVYNL